MKRIVLCSNPYRDRGFKAASAAAALLKQWGVEAAICLPFDVDKSYPLPKDAVLADLEQELPRADAVVCFGGDGTILHTAKNATRWDLPLLGVNVGTMGFIAELESDELSWLEKLSRDEYSLDERMMLDVQVLREGKVVFQDICLNDTVVSSATVARVLRLSVFCDGVQALEFGGDGMIVATPTGSTAYNLSAGGPIVEPGAEVMALTPICAHGVQTRGFVVAGHRSVTIRAGKGGRRNALLSVDGGKAFRLNAGDTVRVVRGEKKTKLIRLKDRSFFDVVHTKL